MDISKGKATNINTGNKAIINTGFNKQSSPQTKTDSFATHNQADSFVRNSETNSTTAKRNSNSSPENFSQRNSESDSKDLEEKSQNYYKTMMAKIFSENDKARQDVYDYYAESW